MAAPTSTPFEVGAALRSGLPSPELVRRSARRENFPVALRLLGEPTRADLLAVYDYARLVDDVGDEAPGDRSALLDELDRDLDRLFGRDRPWLPVVAALAPAVRRHDLPRRPFQLLIEANRRDQQVSEYESWEDLLDYCRLSANPVGDLVLRVFNAWTPQRAAWSDAVCTGLQLVEHWQDVGEDARNGRIYLPAEHRRRHEVEPADLLGARAADRLRGLLAEECARARAVLLTGTRLVRDLPGRARVAVAGYAAGGLATLDAVRDAGFDVLGCDVRPERCTTARHALQLLTGAAP